MLTKKELIKENEVLQKKLKEADEEIWNLRNKLHKPKLENQDTDLNLKYIVLLNKYNKLMDSCLSENTEHIVYNGNLYKIKSIDYHKDAESEETIHVEGINIPREKGLINNLAEPFKNVAKELDRIFFGKED